MPVGPKYAGTAASSSQGGTPTPTAWSNPGNATGNTSTTAATSAPGANGTPTERLRLTNFGFTAGEVPDGNIIDGVVIEVDRTASNTNRGGWLTNGVQIMKSGAEAGSVSPSTSNWNTTQQFDSWGNATTIPGGVSLSPADVRASGFGVSCIAVRNNNAVTLSIYRARITVYHHTLQSSTFTADALINASRSSSAVGDAIILRSQAAALGVDAITLVTVAETTSADAVLEPGGVAPEEFEADAVLSRVGPTFWLSPADGVPIDATPVLEFQIPDVAGEVVYFRIEMDRSSDFDSGSLRRYTSYEDNTDWEYWDGAAWQQVPQAGVPAVLPDVYAGNPARLTITQPLASGTWYRRVRAGTR
jgi:hypothetical protein